MKNVMLDLETLGLHPGSVILSIGAVEFDEDGLGETFYRKLRIVDQTARGARIDEGTLLWWKDQNPEAWKNATLDQQEPAGVLKEFRLWYKFRGATALWANGANFDPPLLGELYKIFEQKVAWHYRHPRDVRTVFDLVGKKLGEYGSENPLAHDALQDAIWQAKETSAALNEIHTWKTCFQAELALRT